MRRLLLSSEDSSNTRSAVTLDSCSSNIARSVEANKERSSLRESVRSCTAWLHRWRHCRARVETYQYKYEFSTGNGGILWGNRVIVLHALQELNSAHSGICRIKVLARSYVWWLEMDQAIEQLVRTCNPRQNIQAKAQCIHGRMLPDDGYEYT